MNSDDYQLVIFASGTGTNFRELINRWKNQTLPGLNPCLLICDKPCGAADYANSIGFPCQIVLPRDFPDKASYEQEILSHLRAVNCDLIALAGYMRIVGSTLLEAYPGRILNLHPALLPDYPGKDAIARAYRDGVEISGVTCHLIDSGVDTGPILSQSVVPLEPGMTLEDFEQAIHEAEHRLYPDTLIHFAEDLEE